MSVSILVSAFRRSAIGSILPSRWRLLLDVVELGLAHGLVELALEVARPCASSCRSTGRRCACARGKSFGPMTTIATTAMTSSSVQPMSNMVAVRYRTAGVRGNRGARRQYRRAGDQVALVFSRAASTSMVRPACRSTAFGLVVVGEPLLEALHALGDVAHQVGNLAPPEKKHDHENDDQPMPDAERTHQLTPNLCRLPRTIADGHVRPQSTDAHAM